MAQTLTEPTQFDYGDLGQVQENNAKMLGDLGKLMLLTLYKRHRIYKNQL